MITREDLISQSLQEHLKTHLYGTFNYPQDRVEIIDAYDDSLFDEKYPEGLDHTFIATAYSFDDGGTPIEMGSSLTEYLHTIDFLVLGHTPTWGRNVANIVKAIFRPEQGSVPLRDFGVGGAPEIDRLLTIEASAERVAEPDPRPWAEFAWTTRVRITDETYAAVS